MDDNLLEQSYRPVGRVEVPLSIDSGIWSEFREVVGEQYRPRRKHKKRPSYAKLLDAAIDSALTLYVNQWNGSNQDAD